MTHRRRSFAERLDFVTSPGFLEGGGPQAVMTDLGMLQFSPDTREMILVSLHLGTTLEHVREDTGWPLAVASPLSETEAPSAEELHVLRSELAVAGGAS